METNSDVESLSDEYDDDHCSDSEGSYQYQVSELPANFLGAVIHRRLRLHADQQPLLSRPASTDNECGGSPTNGNTNTTASITDDVSNQPEKGSENNNNSSNGPPSPWGTSKSKQRVIDELTDEKSDIHLLIGHFTPYCFTCATAFITHRNMNFALPPTNHELLGSVVLTHHRSMTSQSSEVEMHLRVKNIETKMHFTFNWKKEKNSLQIVAISASQAKLW